MLQTESVASASMPTPFPPSLVFQDVEAHLLAMEDMADPGHGDADAWQSAKERLPKRRTQEINCTRRQRV